MRLLDLFCGAGGAAEGYRRAGFDEIVGIDVKPQPNYPFTFIQADALAPPVRLEDFDAIHASPPCQAHVQWQGINRVKWGSVPEHPDLIPPTRQMLLASGRPYVIENVVGAPLRSSVLLCGSMFDLGVRRHRLFRVELADSPGSVRSFRWRTRRLRKARRSAYLDSSGWERGSSGTHNRAGTGRHGNRLDDLGGDTRGDPAGLYGVHRNAVA